MYEGGSDPPQRFDVSRLLKIHHLRLKIQPRVPGIGKKKQISASLGWSNAGWDSVQAVQKAARFVLTTRSVADKNPLSQLWLKEQTWVSLVDAATWPHYLRRASLLLMKPKWAGSQTKPAERQASTQDWPSCDTSSLRELRGGQTGGAETLDAQPRAVEFGRDTNRGPVLLLPPARPGLETLAGTKRGSAVQKSCRGIRIWLEPDNTLGFA